VARKLKIVSTSSYDYTTVGIACPMKDYRLTFFLNDKLGFQLRRTEDLHFGEGDDLRRFSFFIYYNSEERRQFYLVSNYHEEGRLIPSEKGADYFLIVNDGLPAVKKKELISKIQKIPQVLAAYDIPKEKVSNLEAIFEEIELQMI
jgi:hypothetical protein